MTEKLIPRLPLTVDLALWEAVAEATDGRYADSYLSGADHHQDRLLPRTQTAWMRLKDNRFVMHVLTSMGVKLIKPPPFKA
jgi:hypothetical protein